MAKYGTGATPPSGAKSSDGGGERKGSLTNGVGMQGGKEHGEYNTGRSESVCYNHKNEDYSK